MDFGTELDRVSFEQFTELDYMKNPLNLGNETTYYNLNVNVTNSSLVVRTTDYCDEFWQSMWDSYNIAHIYLLITVGVVGCVTNILNILVFTRKLMQSPTNTILTALATTDFLFALFPLTFGLFFIDDKEWSPSHFHAILTLANEFVFLLVHTWSIYLTVILGIWRCLGVLKPLQCRSWFTFKVARWVIFVTLLYGLFLVLIMHISVRVCEADEKENPTTDTEKIRFWRCQPRKWSTVRYWVHAVGIKIGPCIILTLATIALIHGLLKANEQRRTLSPNLNMDHEEDSTVCGEKIKKSQLAEQKTNKMLVVVLLIFILTEAPPGMFTFIAGLLGDQFFTECYRPAAYFWNLIEFISTTTSFFVYLTMSLGFRKTFMTGLSRFLPKSD